MTEDKRNIEDIKRRVLESSLSSDDKIRAIYRLDTIFEERDCVCRRPNIDSFLTWDEQPEGHAFWCNVHEEIGYAPTWERGIGNPFRTATTAYTEATPRSSGVAIGTSSSPRRSIFDLPVCPEEVYF